jgi:hypothetical protein
VSHLGLFLLEKQMELKGIEPVEVFITNGGKIAIKQEAIEFGEPVVIFLSVDQFEKIEHWVFKNKDEIELRWNEGVEDDSNS